MVAPLPPAWESEYLEWMRSKGRTAEGKQMPAELGGDGDGGSGGGGGRGGKKGAAAAAAAAEGAEEQQQDKGKWRPAPRETEADRTGDVTSLRRRLDRRLFLVLGGGAGGAGGTSEALEALPSAEVRQGETTRASAERALAEAVPALSPASSSSPAAAVEAYFVGNAPAGHFGLPGANGGGGGTLFFHRAQLVAAGSGDLLSAADSLFRSGGGGRSGGGSGDVGRAKQHAWLTREELAERLGGGELGELVKAML